MFKIYSLYLYIIHIFSELIGKVSFKLIIQEAQKCVIYEKSVSFLGNLCI